MGKVRGKKYYPLFAKFDALAKEVADIGLYEGMHAINAAKTKTGWELAEQLELPKHKRRLI